MREIEIERKSSPQSPLTPPTQQEPVFDSAHGALKFALNYVHGTLKKSFLAQLMGGTFTGRDLGGLDGAAQAGMIAAELQLLSHLRQSIIIARFSAPTLPCTCKALCCQGFRPSQDWKLAIDYLGEYVLHEGLTGTISHYKLRRCFVTRYFGVKQSLVEVAQACGINKNTATAYNKAVVERLKVEEKFAFYEIEGLLKGCGIVE